MNEVVRSTAQTVAETGEGYHALRVAVVAQIRLFVTTRHAPIMVSAARFVGAEFNAKSQTATLRIPFSKDEELIFSISGLDGGLATKGGTVRKAPTTDEKGRFREDDLIGFRVSAAQAETLAPNLDNVRDPLPVEFSEFVILGRLLDGSDRFRDQTSRKTGVQELVKFFIEEAGVGRHAAT